MAEDTAPQVPPEPAMAAHEPAGARPVGPPSSLELWARAQVLHRCFDDDDGEPHILRGLD